ncbi:MAG TPA: hypothetical protein VIX86_02920 [Streptosporangiaceae bacterium]
MSAQPGLPAQAGPPPHFGLDGRPGPEVQWWPPDEPWPPAGPRTASPPPFGSPAIPPPFGPPAAGTDAGPAVGTRAPARRRGRALFLVLLALSLVGLLASAAGVVVQILPRTFSPAQKQQILAWEMGKRWRLWPAGEIFPHTVSYQVPALALSGPTGLTLAAHRAGISSQASCPVAADPPVAKVLLSHGCTAVLRATYTDATQSLAVTVGVATLPSPAAVRAALRDLPSMAGNSLTAGLRAVPFRHTMVARFGNRQRQLSWDRAAGPYLVFATVGYADGRRRVNESSNLYATAEMLGLEDGVGGWVAGHLGAAPPAPRCPGGPAC